MDIFNLFSEESSFLTTFLLQQGKFWYLRAEFPTPENVSQLRSFLGIANQLTAFVPNLALMTVTLTTRRHPSKNICDLENP